MYYGYVQEGNKYAVLMDEEDLIRLVAVLGCQQSAASSTPLLNMAWDDISRHVEVLHGNRYFAGRKYCLEGEISAWVLKER